MVCAQLALIRIGASAVSTKDFHKLIHGSVIAFYARAFTADHLRSLLIDKVCTTYGGMTPVVNRLSKLTFKTCKVSYSPNYIKSGVNHIATNPTHPLHITQRRRQQEQKKEGLWWYATNAIDTSKLACVRTWARRRLRNAFVEELKAKGYDENGKLVHTTVLQERKDVMNVLKQGRSIDLTGCLRLHGLAWLVPTKFETVKAEMRNLVDALVTAVVDIALGFSGETERKRGFGLRSPRVVAKPQARSSKERKKVMAPASPITPRKKPDSAVVQVAKDLFRVKPNASPAPAHAPAPPPRTRSIPAAPRKMAAESASPQVKPQAGAPKSTHRTRRPSRDLEET